MAQKCAIGFISAIAAASSSFSKSKVAAADGPPPQHQAASDPESSAPPRARNDNPRTSSGGFDPEALERGAKALKEINSSSYAKQVLFCVFDCLLESCFRFREHYSGL